MPSKGLLLLGHISQAASNYDFGVHLTKKTEAFKS